MFHDGNTYFGTSQKNRINKDMKTKARLLEEAPLPHHKLFPAGVNKKHPVWDYVKTPPCFMGRRGRKCQVLQIKEELREKGQGGY